MAEQFLALRREAYAVSAMPEGAARNEAAYQLAKQVIGPRSAWADTDPAPTFEALAAYLDDIDPAAQAVA